LCLLHGKGQIPPRKIAVLDQVADATELHTVDAMLKGDLRGGGTLHVFTEPTEPRIELASPQGGTAAGGNGHEPAPP